MQVLQLPFLIQPFFPLKYKHIAAIAVVNFSLLYSNTTIYLPILFFSWSKSLFDQNVEKVILLHMIQLQESKWKVWVLFNCTICQCISWVVWRLINRSEGQRIQISQKQGDFLSQNCKLELAPTLLGNVECSSSEMLTEKAEI